MRSKQLLSPLSLSLFVWLVWFAFFFPLLSLSRRASQFVDKQQQQQQRKSTTTTTTSFLHLQLHTAHHQQQQLQQQLPFSMSSAKEKFEKEREKTLSEIPDEMKAQFGEIMFAPAEEDDDDDESDNNNNNNNNPTTTTPSPMMYKPVLILNPYDIPPRPYRDVYWWDMFSDAKKKKTDLQHVVYHYGHDVADCYSFVALNELISYEAALQQGWTELPAALQHKLDSAGISVASAASAATGTTTTLLTEDEQELVRGFQEMMEDLLKAPADRKRGIVDFQERHEVSTAATAAATGANKKKKAPAAAASAAKRQKSQK